MGYCGNQDAQSGVTGRISAPRFVVVGTSFLGVGDWRAASQQHAFTI